MPPIANGFYNLKGGQNNKFCTTKYADGKMKCDVNVATDKEKFQIIDAGNEKYNIKDNRGKFCSDNINFIICNKDSGTSNSEQFSINQQTDYYDIIGGKNNLYCADTDDYYKCNRTSSRLSTQTRIYPISELTTPAPTTTRTTTPAATTTYTPYLMTTYKPYTRTTPYPTTYTTTLLNKQDDMNSSDDYNILQIDINR